MPDALATTRRMHEITLGENPRWTVPVLDFRGVPSGIDVTRVCRTGILPQINTGMAGRVAGVGQVGAGLVTPPAEVFPKALARLAELATTADVMRSAGPRPANRMTLSVSQPPSTGRKKARARSTLPEGRSGVASSR